MTASGLTQIKASSVRMALLITMAPFNYRCPNTALRIQALATAEEIAEDGASYQPVTCVMCRAYSSCTVILPSDPKLWSATVPRKQRGAIEMFDRGAVI